MLFQAIRSYRGVCDKLSLRVVRSSGYNNKHLINGSTCGTDTAVTVNRRIVLLQRTERYLATPATTLTTPGTAADDEQLSYLRGITTPPLLQQTIGDLFDTTCSQHPENLAVIAPFLDSEKQHDRWTYEELQHDVNRFAAKLLSLGLEAGDRVGIWSPNNVEWIVTQLATAKVGLILVNINPAYRLQELEYALNKVECKAIITADQFKTTNYMEMLQQLRPKLPHLQHVIHLGTTAHHEGALSYHDDLMSSAESASERDAVEAAAALVQPTDPINLQFTSGTTGHPKAATLTSFGLVNNGKFVGDAMKLTADDTVCLTVPLYHCFGMVLGNLAFFSRGGTVVLPNPDFCPAATWKAIYEENCTTLYGVPTMYQALLHHPSFDAERLRDNSNNGGGKSKLRTGIMAGTNCPVPLMERVIEEVGMKDITICYGMTETSPVSFQSTIDTPLEARTTTVGTIHPHVEAKVIDTETGDTLPRGEVGELCTKGYLIMSGYWNDPERSAQCLTEDGWMRTGDLARITPDGYGVIEGRIKDMIIRGGENIYPREVEDFLFGMEGIQDVQVFGIPDDYYGEVVCAWIPRTSKDNEDDHDHDDDTSKTSMIDEQAVREYCRDAISHFKIPKHIRFVDEFPMTVTGKPQKFIMREQMIQELLSVEKDKEE